MAASSEAAAVLNRMTAGFVGKSSVSFATFDIFHALAVRPAPRTLQPLNLISIVAPEGPCRPACFRMCSPAYCIDLRPLDGERR